jgi:hypothetical protein
VGEPCPKVRLSQDRMPVEPLTQQQSWVRGKWSYPGGHLAAKLDEGGGKEITRWPPSSKAGWRRTVQKKIA